MSEDSGLPSFDLLDAIAAPLEKYKDHLGPLYPATRILFGALVFLALLFAIIFAPMLALSGSGFRTILFCQLLLLLVYVMLLITIRMHVLERFVFALCLLMVLAAAPNASFAESRYRQIQRESPEFAAQGPDVPKVDIFFYGMVRGLGNLGWSLPFLFYFFTFWPTLRRRGEDALRMGLRTAFWSGVGLQVVAAVAIFWVDDVWGRYQAEATAAVAELQDSIRGHQTGYFVSAVLTLLIGFIALAVMRLLSRARDGRSLAILVVGVSLTQLAFSLNRHHARQLNERYPAVRGNRIEAFEDAAGNVVFSNVLFEDIDVESLAEWKLHLACRQPESLSFTYVATRVTDFNQRYDRNPTVGSLRRERPASLFCQEPAAGPSSL